jgi:ERCC4-type nuclease
MDTREPEFMETFINSWYRRTRGKYKPVITREQMETCDYRDTEGSVYIERKRMDDFLATIRDEERGPAQFKKMCDLRAQHKHPLLFVSESMTIIPSPSDIKSIVTTTLKFCLFGIPSIFFPSDVHLSYGILQAIRLGWRDVYTEPLIVEKYRGNSILESVVYQCDRIGPKYRAMLSDQFTDLNDMYRAGKDGIREALGIKTRKSIIVNDFWIWLCLLLGYPETSEDEEYGHRRDWLEEGEGDAGNSASPTSDGR